MDEWMATYRSYSGAELTEELAWLKAQSRNLYLSQAEGSRSYQRSTQDIRIRLAACTRVIAESASGDSYRGIADFSNVQP